MDTAKFVRLEAWPAAGAGAQHRQRGRLGHQHDRRATRRSRRVRRIRRGRGASSWTWTSSAAPRPASTAPASVTCSPSRPAASTGRLAPGLAASRSTRPWTRQRQPSLEGSTSLADEVAGVTDRALAHMIRRLRRGQRAAAGRGPQRARRRARSTTSATRGSPSRAAPSSTASSSAWVSCSCPACRATPRRRPSPSSTAAGCSGARRSSASTAPRSAGCSSDLPRFVREAGLPHSIVDEVVLDEPRVERLLEPLLAVTPIDHR